MDASRLGEQCKMMALSAKAVDWWNIFRIAMPEEQQFLEPPGADDIDQINFPFDAVAGVCNDIAAGIPSGDSSQPDGTCKTGFFSLTDFVFAALDNDKMKKTAMELASLLRSWAITDWATGNPPSIVQDYVNQGQLWDVCPLVDSAGPTIEASSGCYRNSTCIYKFDEYTSCTITNTGSTDGSIFADEAFNTDSMYMDAISNEQGEMFYTADLYDFGIPIESGGTVTVEYGVGMICPVQQAAQYDARSSMCCKTADAASGQCTSYCRPGALDCIDPNDPGQVLITQDQSEQAQNFFFAGAIALEQYAAAIPRTDDMPAESPWNLNDFIVDLATGGRLGCVYSPLWIPTQLQADSGACLRHTGTHRFLGKLRPS